MNIKVGDVFKITQEYTDWYKSNHGGFQIGALPPVGTVFRVAGFHEWKGEITIRAEVSGGGIVPIPARFVKQGG